MLKRQRPSSPSAAASQPLEEDSGMKRRRIAPPVLDGRSRGWVVSPDDSDGESTDSEADVQQFSPELSSEYKSVNSLLNQLHTLHQHRHHPSNKPAQKINDEVESKRNIERYEETNKLLGSLLLSRRRQLNGNDTG